MSGPSINNGVGKVGASSNGTVDNFTINAYLVSRKPNNSIELGQNAEKKL